MGITPPDENRMTVKVGSPPATPAILGSGLTNLDFRTSWNGFLPLRLCSSFVPSSFGGESRLWCPRTSKLTHWVRVRRARFLRAHNRPLRDFFVFIEAPQQSGGSSPWSIRPNSRARDSGLTPMSLNLQRIGRTRATDIDSEGRRAGGPDPDDVNSDIMEKDVLPAYEVEGGPPDYGQFLAVDLGTGTNTRLQMTETVPVGPYPQSHLVGTSSGTMDPPTQLDPALDVQLPHPPLPSYTPAKAITHPITPP